MRNDSHHTMQRVITQYFQTWEAQDPDLLNDIFTVDAAYVVRPFDVDIYRGIGSIKRYWREHPVSRQIEPHPEILKVAYGESCAFVEWQAEFDTHERTHKCLRGIMILDFDGNKVKELREHFDTETKEIDG